MLNKKAFFDFKNILMIKFQIQIMLLLFCNLSTNSCSHDQTNYLWNDIKIVYKIKKYKTNYL